MLFSTDAGASGSVVISQIAMGRRNDLQFSVDGANAAYGFDQEHPEILMVGGLDGNLALHRGSRAASAAAAQYSLLPPGLAHGYQDCTIGAGSRDVSHVELQSPLRRHGIALAHATG
jgi:hypothetical protein